MEPRVVSTEPRTPGWQQLRDLSLRPGGFKEKRLVLWPQLLNVNVTYFPTAQSDEAAERTQVESNVFRNEEGEVEPHPDERQVELDTDRSFVLYPVVDIKDRAKQQHKLHDLIVEIFRKRRRLSYFQGYHDIISVLFLTLPTELQLPCAEKLSLYRLRDSMGASLEPVVGLLRVLQRVLKIADPEYAELLAQNTPLPYFALSNLLTLFSHDMPTLPLIQHVFDYLLCRQPIAVVYLAAALILSRKQEVELLQKGGEEGMIHSLLSGLPDLFDEDDPPDGAPTNAGLVHGSEPRGPACNDQPAADEGNIDDFAHDPPNFVDSGSPVAVLSNGSEEDALVDPVESGGEASFHTALDASAKTVPDREPVAPLDPPVETCITAEVSATDDPSSASPSPLQKKPSGSFWSDEMPSKLRMSLSSLLERADELYTLYPPCHASVDLSSIMGPQSVMLTWSENPSELPSADEAELMVTQPQLIVLPAPEDSDKKEKIEAEEDETHKAAKRRRRKLRKPLRIGSVVIERRTAVASAVLMLGVAMAVYGLQTTPDRHHGASKELRKLTTYVGGLVLGFGGKLWDRLLVEH
ncbi:rab-GTPase-TBC domain-containing protein [Cytidiella melzeri]|nr:rab-GTPase-TBC domain-containing protein [Cytidiella melzeri]